MNTALPANQPVPIRGERLDQFNIFSRPQLFPAAFLLIVAVLSRAHTIGNPVIQIDDQWYLLVGRRLLDGAIPFVDIFDRKPIGLFLLYAAIRSLGGTGVVPYQLAALVSAWLTSLIVYRMATSVTNKGGALAAGALYLLSLTIAGGEGGQSPVFYNLPVALAVFVVWRTSRASLSHAALRSSGSAAMLLIGIAMQIKYNAVFEGIFLGIVLVATEWTQRRNATALIVSSLVWIAAALLPTIAAAGAYWWLGHFPEWLFANVTSIASRRSESPEMQRYRVRVMAAIVGPLVASVPLRRWLGARPDQPKILEDLRFFDMWAASALLGVVIFGTWYDHYALPLFAPLALVASPLATRRAGGAFLIVLLCYLGFRGQAIIRKHERARGDRLMFEQILQASGSFHGCPLVYEAIPAFYDRTNSCLPTTRAFPGHLNQLNEIGATGIDEVEEVTRIMRAGPPRVIVIEPAIPEENLQARAALYKGLRNRYTVAYRYLSKPAHVIQKTGKLYPAQWITLYKMRNS